MKWLRLAAALMFLLASAPLLEAQKLLIEPQRWGFDGKFVPNEFNQVRIKIRNIGSKDFRGMASLQRGGGFGAPGAPLVAPCFVSAGSARTLSFYPYVMDKPFGWQFRAGDRGLVFSEVDSPNVETVKKGRPAMVYLRPSSQLTSLSPGLRSYPVDAFPSTVAGTGGLAVAILDHIPPWREPQNQAFVDWIRGGGQVHVFHDRGDYPKFQGSLAVLRGTEASEPLGRGMIYRHAELISAGAGSRIAASFSSPVEDPSKVPANAEDSIVPKTVGWMRAVVRPKHNWTLIYWVILAFLVVVVPAQIWLNLRRTHFLVSIGLLVGAIVATTIALFEIGQRGFDEKSSGQSLSYARQLEPGRFDAFQVHNEFSTRSVALQIKHAANGSLYSAAEAVESVPGQVVAGARGRFLVTIPLFTSRHYLHRGVIESEPVAGRILDLPLQQPRTNMRLEWKGPKVIAAFAVYAGKVFELDWRPGSTLVARDSGQSAMRWYQKVVLPSLVQGYRYQSTHNYYDWNEVSGEKFAQKILPAFVEERRGWFQVSGKGSIPARLDQVALFALCKSPKEFCSTTRGETSESATSYTIYDLVLRKGQ